MRFDAVRNAYVLLAPERAFDLDQTAVTILDLVDGQRNIEAIVDTLAVQFDADRAMIEADVIEMLSDLVAKRVVER
jgi:pyrroloquinoline quinone biosynthesis protein D